MKLHAVLGVTEEGSPPEVITCWDDAKVEADPKGFEEHEREAADNPHYVSTQTFVIHVDTQVIELCMSRRPPLKSSVSLPPGENDGLPQYIRPPVTARTQRRSLIPSPPVVILGAVLFLIVGIVAMKIGANLTEILDEGYSSSY